MNSGKGSRVGPQARRIREAVCVFQRIQLLERKAGVRTQSTLETPPPGEEKQKEENRRMSVKQVLLTCNTPTCSPISSVHL